MTGLFIAIAILVLFEMVALRYGADTRDGRDWTKHCSPLRLPVRSGKTGS